MAAPALTDEKAHEEQGDDTRLDDDGAESVSERTEDAAGDHMQSRIELDQDERAAVPEQEN